MNLEKNYYAVLNIDFNTDLKNIKKSYYSQSRSYHPDKNPSTGAKEHFQLISEAYSIISDEEQRYVYDKKSKYGKLYNEIEELFKININYDFNVSNEKYEKIKNREILDIIVYVDDDFNGTIDFPRLVICKGCNGSGKDMVSKIIIKDEFGNEKYFDADDGCDFCEGTGLDYNNNSCGFCKGKGKVGLLQCSVCNGERRILGKQVVNNIVLEGDETKIPAMGNYSYYDGRVGFLILKKR